MHKSSRFHASLFNMLVMLLELCLLPLNCNGASGPLRNTSYGMIEGIFYRSDDQGTEAEVFLGVPYAEAPIGNLRLKMPVPPTPWSLPKEAKQAPPYCVQFWYDYPENNLQYGRKQSEDCLYLNIFSPARKEGVTPPAEGYPVLVWVHGGSYQVGGANVFPVAETVNQFVARYVVVVYVNYRLGLLGFFSLMHRECPGNFGLADQILALQWVQQNIRQFGGNPNKVTIAGESAGGASVSILAVSPQAKGLLHGAIVRSGSSLSAWAVRSRSTDMNSVSAAQLLGCYPRQEVSSVLQCLQSASVEKFVETWRYIAHDDLGMFFVKNHKPMNGNHPVLAHTFFTPVVDSFMQNASIIPTYPQKLVRENAHVPLMIGTTTGECTGYVAWLAHAEGQNFLTKIGELEFVVPSLLYANPEHVKFATGQHYMAPLLAAENGKKYNRYKVLVQIASDQNFVVPATREAQLYAKAGQPVFSYSFDHEHTKLNQRYFASGVSVDFELSGAGHGYDSVFIFRNSTVLDHEFVEMEFSDADNSVSCFLTDTIVNFLNTGNPANSSSAIGRTTTAHCQSVPSSESKWPTFRTNFGDTLYISEQGNRVVSALTSKFYFWSQTVPAIESLSLSADFKFQETLPGNVSCERETETLTKYKALLYTALGFIVLLLILCCACGLANWSWCEPCGHRCKEKYKPVSTRTSGGSGNLNLNQNMLLSELQRTTTTTTSTNSNGFLQKDTSTNSNNNNCRNMVVTAANCNNNNSGRNCAVVV